MTFKSQWQNFTPLIKKRLEFYFGFKVGDQDESLAPDICCVTCMRFLTGWVNGLHQMPFAILLIHLLLLFNKHKRDHLQIQTHSEISWSATCIQWRAACSTTFGKSDFEWLQLWFWWRSRMARTGQCWLWSDIWSKMFLIWTPLNTKKYLQPCLWFDFV